MIHKYEKIKFNQQKKYTKYYLLEIVILISLFIGLYPILSIKSADMSAIKANLEENLKLDSINIGDEKTLKNLYYINIGSIEDFISYAPKSNMDVEEILILKLKHGANMDEIKTKVSTRLEKQSESFKNYNPEKYGIIENAILEEEGQYLIFIISENSSSIYKLIKDNFK